MQRSFVVNGTRCALELSVCPSSIDVMIHTAPTSNVLCLISVVTYRLEITSARLVPATRGPAQQLKARLPIGGFTYALYAPCIITS